jgi:hypothetical protein
VYDRRDRGDLPTFQSNPGHRIRLDQWTSGLDFDPLHLDNFTVSASPRHHRLELEQDDPGSSRLQCDRHDKQRKSETSTEYDSGSDGSSDRALLDALFDSLSAERGDEDSCTKGSTSGRCTSADTRSDDAGEGADTGGGFHEEVEECGDDGEGDTEDCAADGSVSGGPEDVVGVGVRVSHDGCADDGANDGGECGCGDSEIRRGMAREREMKRDQPVIRRSEFGDGTQTGCFGRLE